MNDDPKYHRETIEHEAQRNGEVFKRLSDSWFEMAKRAAKGDDTFTRKVDATYIGEPTWAFGDVMNLVTNSTMNLRGMGVVTERIASAAARFDALMLRAYLVQFEHITGPEAFTCTTCKVRAGDKCVTKGNNPRGATHDARLWEFKRLRDLRSKA